MKKALCVYVDRNVLVVGARSRAHSLAQHSPLVVANGFASLANKQPGARLMQLHMRLIRSENPLRGSENNLKREAPAPVFVAIKRER